MKTINIKVHMPQPMIKQVLSSSEKPTTTFQNAGLKMFDEYVEGTPPWISHFFRIIKIQKYTSIILLFCNEMMKSNISK